MAAAIAFTGIAMIVSLTLWLVVTSGRSDGADPAAGASPRWQRCPAWLRLSTTAAAVAAPISLPENAAALAAAHKPYPAALPPTTATTVRHFTITLKDRVFDVAPGIHYSGWTFDGTAPGPVVHVRRADGRRRRS